jgi:hypothetical protein
MLSTFFTVATATGLLAVIIIPLVLTVASFLRVRHPNLPYSTGSLYTWCGLIMAAHTADYIEAGLVGFLFLLAAIVVGTVLYSFWYHKDSPFDRDMITYYSHNSLKEVLLLACIWIAGIIVLLLPSFWVFPSSTVMTGVGISNDAIHHAFLSLGFAATRDITLSESFSHGLENYPRAAHSLLFQLATLLTIDPLILLLPFILIGYSFIVVCLHSLLVEEKHSISLDTTILVTLATVVPFLTSMSIHLLYFAHIVATPVILFTIYKLLKIDVNKNIVPQLLQISPLIAVSVLLYSIFPLLFFVFALFFTGALGFFNRKTFHFGKPTLVDYTTLLIATLVSIPSIFAFFRLFLPSIVGAAGSENLAGSSGIFPSYLDLTHLTGMWPSGQEFRSTPIGTKTYLLLQIILLIVVLLAANSLTVFKKILVVNLSVLLISTIFSGTYVFFKIFLMMIPIALASATYTLLHLSSFLFWRIFAAFIITLYFYFCSIKTLPNHFHTHVRSHTNFAELDSVVQKSCRNHSCLLLTREDWIRYFIRQNDDFAPMTQYLYKPWNGEQITWLMIDEKSKEEAYSYLSSTSEGQEVHKLINIKCHRLISKRWNLYNLDCNV